MSKKLEYRSKNDRWFLEFLPQEVFDGMNKEERMYYQQYRNHHRFIHDGNEKISKHRKQIKKLQDEIKSIREKINGDEYKDGWNLKMKEGYSNISHLTQSFEFWCSVGLRTRLNQHLKNEEREQQGRSVKQIKQSSTTYEGKTFKVNPKFVVRVESPLKGEWFKNIYVGDEGKVRDFLKTIYPNTKDWDKIGMVGLKNEIKEVYVGYTRYHIYKSNPHTFCEKKHNLDKVEDWVKKMGDKIYDWMDK